MVWAGTSLLDRLSWRQVNSVRQPSPRGGCEVRYSAACPHEVAHLWSDEPEFIAPGTPTSFSDCLHQHQNSWRRIHAACSFRCEDSPARTTDSSSKSESTRHRGDDKLLKSYNLLIYYSFESYSKHGAKSKTETYIKFSSQSVSF